MDLDASKLNIGEIELLHWQYNGSMGSFKAALWKCIEAADNNNLAKLKQGFPEQVDAYVAFISQPGYWPEVLTRAGLAKKQPPAANDGEGKIAGETPPSATKPYDH